MKQAFAGISSYLRFLGSGWLVIFGAVAIIFVMLVSAGSSDVQSNDENSVVEEAPRPFLVEEGPPPPGANVPCSPTRKHPYPVVLVHETFETMEQNWAVLSPRLKEKGYCVFALNYGNRGLGPIQDSARELDRFVNKVLAYTGVEKVSLVGHSQGGMTPRYWIKCLGGDSRVEDLVGLAPSNYGTELGEATNENSTPEDWDIQQSDGSDSSSPCRSCEQQQAGSRFLEKLNHGDDTPGPGAFTQIATDEDEIIIPYTRCFLRGEEHTANLTLQDYNGGLIVTHQNIYNDPYAQALVFDALAHRGPANLGRAFDSTPAP